MNTKLTWCLVAVLSWSAPALAVTEFASFTLTKTKYKAPAAVPAPDAEAEDLFKTKFIAKGELVLAGGSDGIDLATEDVRITVGDFSQTLPAGSLAVSPRGVGKFKSLQLGSLRVVIVKPTSTGFKWVVKATKLLVPAPDTLTLQIGDDAGQLDLIAGSQEPIAAVVRGTMVSGDPIAGLDGVVITVPCPAGMCSTVTADGGRFSVSASLGMQNMLQDGRGITGGSYPRISQSVLVAPGVNEVGVFALPELDFSNGESVAAGTQAAQTTVNSNPLSTGGSVAMTIAPGSTVTFPGGASGGTVAISEVPLSLIPMEFGSFVASPVVVTTQPGGTTISPPADVVFPNPYPGMSDGEQLMIYGYNNAVGDWQVIAVGTIQNGGSEIFAPGAIGEFAWYFPACTPQVTTVVGLATVNGSPAPGVQVLIQGRTVSTFAPAQDLDGDADLDNFIAAGIAGGCPGTPFNIQTFFRSASFGSIVSGSVNLTVAAVPGGTTDLDTVALPILAACGNGARELGEQCDGGDAAVCPGQCQADCTCFQECGNDVLELGEQCDGTADAACPGGCAGDCTCPASCGNDVQDPGESCDGADSPDCPDLCSASCTCPESLTCGIGAGSHVALRTVAFPSALEFAVSGTFDLACASYEASGGPHACGCAAPSFAPVVIPGIGAICLQTLEGCPSGEITCSGGDPRDVVLTADHNIGSCTDNAACASQCATTCLPAAVAQSGCSGFCSLTGSPCMNDSQCQMFNEGLCNGPDPVTMPNRCQCQCLETANGVASAPGTLQCSLGLRVSIENAAPCNGVDPLIQFGDTCLPLTTSTSAAVVIDANGTPGTTIGPVVYNGAPLSCETLGLSAGTASGMALRGSSVFFGSQIGDTVFSLRADCL